MIYAHILSTGDPYIAWSQPIQVDRVYSLESGYLTGVSAISGGLVWTMWSQSKSGLCRGCGRGCRLIIDDLG